MLGEAGGGVVAQPRLRMEVDVGVGRPMVTRAGVDVPNMP